VACVCAPAALANSTLTTNNSGGSTSVAVTAGSGVVNAMTVIVRGDQLTVTDPGEPINEAVGECTGDGTNTVQCTLMFPLSRLDADTGDLNDSLRGETDTSIIILYGGDGDDEVTASFAPGASNAGSNLHGDDSAHNPAGDGNDTLTGGDRFDFLDGDGGVDTLRGGAGPDTLTPGPGAGERAEGGPGDDRFNIRPGEGDGEVLDGGPGADTLNVRGFDVAPAFTTVLGVDLAAGTFAAATPSTLTSLEHVSIRNGVAALTGSDAANLLTTAAADDVVDPRAGADFVDVGAGADRLVSRDGFFDRISCGTGADTVEADQLDVLIDCESASRAFVPPAGVDATDPVCSVERVPSRLRRKRFLRRGISAQVGCDEAVGLEARLTVAVRPRRKRLVAARAGDLVLAETALPVAAGTRRLALRVPRRLRGVLGRRFVARLAVVATDQFGNSTTIARRLRVRR
jgi:RTX calcium-binding nonapeptide repeat (4 copies)